MVILCGCSENSELYETIDTGTVVSMSEVSTSFNDSQRMIISTTKGIFTVRGVHSVTYDKITWINVYKQRNYLCVEGKNSCWFIYE